MKYKGKNSSLNIATERGSVISVQFRSFLPRDKTGKTLSEFSFLKLKLSAHRNRLQYCNKLCIIETGRRLGDRFREHLRDEELNDEDASKHVVRHFNLPNHSKQHTGV